MRGLEILKDAGFDVRVLSIPQGKDPDEYVRVNGKDAFIKLINQAEGLVEYRIKKAGEGLNFRDNNDLIKYGKKVTEILAKVNPIEKDIYIKKISEDTGIREQALYDLLSKEMTKNTQNEEFMNNKEDNGTKLYKEPAYVKAERALLKLCLEEEYFNYISNLISQEELILPEHKEIFSIIKEAKRGNINNIITFLESKCTDLKTIEEIVKIKDQQVLIGKDNKKLIQDLIKQIDSYKLNEKLKELKQKQKILESQGKIEESIQIAIELKKLMSS